MFCSFLQTKFGFEFCFCDNKKHNSSEVKISHSFINQLIIKSFQQTEERAVKFDSSDFFPFLFKCENKFLIYLTAICDDFLPSFIQNCWATIF